MPALTNKKLTHRRALFAAEYIVDFNAKQAAIRAGFAVRGAAVTGFILLRDQRVLDEIARNLEARVQRTHITQDRVLQELARVAFFDPRKLFHPDGSPKAINDLDDEVAAALNGLDVQEVFEGSGEGRRFVGYVKKYKVLDKNTALSNAMRHLGMFKDSVALTGPDGGPVEMSVAHSITTALSKAIKERLRVARG